MYQHIFCSILLFQSFLVVELHDFQKKNRDKRAVASLPQDLWQYGVIPYEIDEEYDGWHVALFKQGMRHWSNHTCIRFVEREPSEHPDYIYFKEQPCGCCSNVGRKGNGSQYISIGPNCATFGTVVHELGHVIGFWHEHTRPDRDQHVHILTDNIVDGQQYNFEKLNEDEVNLLGSVYDYNSIMHYGRQTFAKGPFIDTIEPIEQSNDLTIGQRVGLSKGDITQANVLYNCSKCGKTFQDSSGSFSFNTRNFHGDCEWRFEAANGERIILNITFDSYQNSDSENYLEIWDGYWKKNKINKTLNGETDFETFISTKNRLTLILINKNQENHLKFTVNYEVICGGEFYINSEMFLESPNYPDNYPSNRKCVWIITVPDDFQIMMQFHTFEIEHQYDCIHDYVEIRDGPSSNSSLIGTFCGFKLPPEIISSTNQLYIHFSTDDSVEKNGFSATVWRDFDECSQKKHDCLQKCINTLGSYYCKCDLGYELHSDGRQCESSCGGLIEALDGHLSGTITSPSFPELYPNDKSCIWEIHAPPKYKISLNFSYFDVEGNNLNSAQYCEYDKVEIFSILEETKKDHGMFCGPKPPKMLISDSNIIQISFTSDDNLQRTGFSIRYHAFPDNCAINNGKCDHHCTTKNSTHQCHCRNGYYLAEDDRTCLKGFCTVETRAERGKFMSINYPEPYPTFLNCVYNITVRKGSRIRLSFRTFDLEYHPQCMFDWVEVFDGPDSTGVSLGKFCGYQKPPVLTSSGNHLYIEFRTDGTIGKKGFKARHIAF